MPIGTSSILLPATLAKWATANIWARYARFTEQLRKVAVFSFAQVLLIAGCAGIAYGCFLWWHPLGFMVGGWEAIALARLIADDSLDKR
jgi:hypothetical protein